MRPNDITVRLWVGVYAMPITWRERLALEPHLWDFTLWPVIPVDSIKQNTRKAYWRNLQVIQALLNHIPANEVARRFNLTGGRVSQLLDRALGGDTATPPALTYGLVPFANIKAKHRRSPLPNSKQPSGAPHAFGALLDQVPNLRECLDDLILAKLKDTDYAQTITPWALHGEFKRVLAENHCPLTQYPYTSESLAKETVRQYLHKRTAQLRLERRIRQNTATRPLITKTHRHALDHIEIDEHKIDLHSSIHLQIGDTVTPIRLGCATVLLAIDCGSECILGYYIAPTRHPTQIDLLTLLSECVSQWQPRSLIVPELSYLPGACFPSGIFQGTPLTFGNVKLDNALMHLAHSIRNVLTIRAGASLHFGRPGVPEIRDRVEFAFQYICKIASHRFASTTGSHPKDLKKESRKNQKRVPVITYQMFNDVLSVVLTEFNLTPRASLDGASPLEAYRYFTQQHYTRYLPHLEYQQWRPLIGEKITPLHWYHHENRAPHINFCHSRYLGNGLDQALSAGDKQIRIIFNWKNIRSVEAFRLNGVKLGTLSAESRWQQYPHSYSTQHYIHKHTTALRLASRDPLASLFRYLFKHKGQEKRALHLLRIYDEYTENFKLPLQIPKSAEEVHTGSESNPFQWSTTNAFHSGA